MKYKVRLAIDITANDQDEMLKLSCVPNILHPDDKIVVEKEGNSWRVAKTMTFGMMSQAISWLIEKAFSRAAPRIIIDDFKGMVQKRCETIRLIVPREKVAETRVQLQEAGWESTGNSRPYTDESMYPSRSILEYERPINS